MLDKRKPLAPIEGPSRINSILQPKNIKSIVAHPRFLEVCDMSCNSAKASLPEEDHILAIRTVLKKTIHLLVRTTALKFWPDAENGGVQGAYEDLLPSHSLK
jgi:hypothetical protein